jgi:sensor histidine kinase YesM
MPRVMGVYWAVLAISTGLSSYLRSRNKEREAAQTRLTSARLETQLARAQMNSLKSQLQPHFLFNSLHTVGGLIRAKQDPTALKTLSALGGLLRKTLDLGESQRVTLREELEIAELYLSIEQIRFGDRLKSSVEVSPEALELRVPALVLLPLVENSVHHAVEPRVEGGQIETRAFVEGERLVVEVVDDGAGFPEWVLLNEAPDDGRTHIGLANTRRRLEMLYGDSLELRVENRTEGGARVRFAIPVERGGTDG